MENPSTRRMLKTLSALPVSSSEKQRETNAQYAPSPTLSSENPENFARHA
jgi:hypothetical protein